MCRLSTLPRPRRDGRIPDMTQPTRHNCSANPCCPDRLTGGQTGGLIRMRPRGAICRMGAVHRMAKESALETRRNEDMSLGSRGTVRQIPPMWWGSRTGSGTSSGGEHCADIHVWHRCGSPAWGPEALKRVSHRHPGQYGVLQNPSVKDRKRGMKLNNLDVLKQLVEISVEYREGGNELSSKAA